MLMKGYIAGAFPLQVIFFLPLFLPFLTEIQQSVLADGLSQLFDQMYVVVEIVDGVKPQSQGFPGHVKMSQIGPGMVAAGIASAPFFNGPLVGGMPSVLDHQLSGRGKEHPVTCITGGDDAVEEVDSSHDCINEILGFPQPHEIPGTLLGQEGGRTADHTAHNLSTFTDT